MKFNFYLLFLLLISLPLYSQNALIDTFFTGGTKIDSAGTRSVDWTTKPGELQLQTGENENLAKNKYAYLVYRSSKVPTDTAARNALRVIDGNFFSPSYIQILSLNAAPGGEGSYIVIDLQAIRSVNRVKIWTLGFYPGGANNITPNLRPRAYTIYAGLDTLQMDKILQVADNPYGITDDVFENVVVCRFIKITIDVIDPIQSTVIPEIEVFGKGFLPEGFYTSSVRDAGQAVNWGKVEWIGDKPDGTQISVRLRTGNSKTVDSTWSPWSDSTTASGSLLDVFEPRRYAQYQIRLGTTSTSTPVVKSIKINYDTKLLAQATEATITPQFSPILEENLFTYNLRITKGVNEFSVDTLIISTPTPTQLVDVKVNGSPVAYQATIKPEYIKIGFQTSIVSTVNIELKLRFTPFLVDNKFSAYIISKENPGNPQRVDTKFSGGREAWSVITTGVPKKLIIDMKIYPNPFTPNADGINDQTKIEFYVANIAEPKSLIGNQMRDLSIKIFDLNGRLVRDLFNGKTSAAAYVADKGYVWDGRDDNGKYLRPGVYIVQVYIDSENGGEQVSKTVTIAY